MAGMITVLVLSNRIPAVSASMKQMVGRAVAETILEIEAGAKERCPVRTGNLRASISSQMQGMMSGIVGTGPQAPYAIFVHNGTRGRSPRPFLKQAAEAARPAWYARVHVLTKDAV